ncbi:DUF4193 domain-containing protein [Specibacter cremeus]|uniref:DUF4193 domain-containing protein n=1 Tax=Specibacter cremeus TaxID=1629051 RepID=UPI000F793AF7|nr:DUF4193 domain-containing protein [Specibacter cremeus]
MATDYDEPRAKDDETAAGVINVLTQSRSSQQSAAVIDLEESDAADGYLLPGGDVPAEELQVEVLPAQADEFTCASCFMIRHRTQIARTKDGLSYCKDCEG